MSQTMRWPADDVVIWVCVFLVICMILGTLSYVGFERWSDMP